MHLLPPLLPLNFSLSLLSLLSLPTAFAASSPQQASPATLYTATLHHLPSTPTDTISSSAKQLAVITYHPLYPHLSSLSSFTPPKNTTNTEDLTQVAIYLPNGDVKGERFRTSATATNGFYAPYKGRFRIVVEPLTGEVVGASWHAYLPKTSPSQPSGKENVKGNGKAGSGKEKGVATMRGDFDIITVKRAPGVVFDKPAKGKGAATAGTGSGGGSGAGSAGPEGEEEVAEKTFLQK
ncbi:hypothetical protein OEA41_003839 [Lepraria neglecta]|uniref:Uncharacterized protein n=1 Tax=Lepraria neglecta TaxID=209136 RepID=A0AAD9Z515_9LECA|nr:hypothetical protein OEA41_003839 [Lepraria neglecta]